uniref:Glycosyltransferase RgtA/B/C/D-like domain-containing protein n=1 Tax=candidate division WOR-3 bacterium TaxID=2052148 RepID=A0A7C6ECT2_UNCW3
MKLERIILILSPILIIFITIIFLKSNPNLTFVYDDSYITLQFAKNFFAKGGLTFDGIHYNLGATSPLHIFLLATFNILIHNLHLTNILLGILSLLTLFYAIFFYAKLLYNNWRISLLAAFLMITTGWLYFDALSGMETILFIALMILTLYLLERKSLFYSIPLAGSILTRPEGWFLFLAILSFLLLHRFIKKEVNFVKEILIPIIITIIIVSPYLVSNYKNTGSFLPNTAFQKTLFFGEIGLPFRTKLKLFFNGLNLFYTDLVYPFFFLIFISLPFAQKIYRRLYFIIFLFLFYISYLYLFPGSTGHYWCRYQHIFYPFIILIIAEGFYNLVQYYQHQIKKDKIVFLTKRLALTASLLFLISINQYLSIRRAKTIYYQSVKSTEASLINLANYFKEKTPADAVIATHDIGVLGYYSERRINDLVGLINPKMTQFYKKPNSNLPIPFCERNILDYVKNESDFLVMFDFFKLFLNINPDTLPDIFIFLGETSPIYGLNQKYRIYGIAK